MEPVGPSGAKFNSRSWLRVRWHTSPSREEGRDVRRLSWPTSRSGPGFMGLNKGKVHSLLGKTSRTSCPDFTDPGIAKEGSTG